VNYFGATGSSYTDIRDDNTITSAIRSTNGLLSRLSNYTASTHLTPLIHGLQLSKARYALPLFCDIRLSENDPTSATMHQVQVQLNKGLRTVLGTTIADRVPVRDLVNQVGVPTFNQLAAETTLMDIWRHFNYGLPASQYLLPVEKYVEQGRTTRRTGKGLMATMLRDDFGAARFFQQGSRLWNEAPQELRDETIETKAKKIIREFTRTLPL